MDTDPWQQWRAFTAPLGETGPAGAASFAPPTDFAQRFQNAAHAFLGAAGASAAPPVDAARVFSDALRDLFAPLQPPWNFSGPASAAAGKSAFSPDFLALGVNREHQLRWQRLSEAWQQLDEAQRRLQRLWIDALRDAGGAFAARLGQPPSSAKHTEVIRQLYDTWIDCAEDAYSRIAHSAPFCDALAGTVNAGSRWRHELQAIVEHSAKLLDLPTRSEINTLQRRLRSVEAELREARRRPQAQAPKPKTRPRRKTNP